MKKLIYPMLLTGFAMLFNYCNPPKNIKNNASPDAAHNSGNALDWDGIYRGVLPCADCPGIQTTVYLNKDSSYRVRLKYLERENTGREYSGKFTWNAQGNSITLSQAGNSSQPVRYFVAENTLTQLDMAGNKITGPHAEDYILSKSNYAIVEKYWKLTELYGKQVQTDSSFRNEPHIILKDRDNRVTGNGGCNSISGSFEVRGLNRISFSRMISTQMACPNMSVETQLLKALAEADHFDIAGDRLVLNKGRTPLAGFRTVYMK
jgi:uncharacterized lipoprotein NlpE involved in copper resistance